MTPLRSLDRAASTVHALLRDLRTATERAITALRDADSSSLESALDARDHLLARSQGAFAELALARGAVERLASPAIPAVPAALAIVLRAAAELRTLDANLNVALTAVHDQARAELRALDQVGVQTSRYRPLGQAQRATLDVTW